MAKRILVVDNEKVSRDLVEAILGEARFAVEYATDGGQALALATADPPNLIILDLLMPRMNGIEVCRQLKQHSSTAAVPILVVTAMGHLGTTQAA